MAIKAEKMREIRDLIGNPDKWIQYNFEKGPTGYTAYCIDGAIIEATQANWNDMHEYEQFIAKIINEMFPNYIQERFPDGNNNYLNSEIPFEEWVARFESDDTIFAFNDCSTRTWEEVFSVMDKAVVRAEEIEGLLGEGE